MLRDYYLSSLSYIVVTLGKSGHIMIISLSIGVKAINTNIMNKTPVQTTKSFLISTILILVLSSNLSAFEKNFPPYAKNKFPTVCQIHAIKPSSESNRNNSHFKSSYSLTDQKQKLLLTLNMNYQKDHSGIYLTLKNSSQEIYIKPIKIGSHPSHIERVRWAYLNKDSRKDLIISMDEGDGYLSSGRQQITFLLSTKTGYVAKKIEAYYLEQKDFYDYSSDKKCEYLHQAFITDGKNYYWSYNILQFLGGKVVIKNKLSRYFPKWIQMTSKSNHKAANLTTVQKEKLSKEYLKQVRSSIN